MLTTEKDLSASLELVLDLHCDIGESPIWDADTSTLTLIDQTPGRVFRFDPGSGALSRFEVGHELGAAIPRISGGFVFTSQNGLRIVRKDSGPGSLLVAIDEENADTRLNDAKCDRVGRLWTGTFSRSFARKASALYRVDTDLNLTTVVREVSISNGIAWSPDGSRMYYADTATYGVDVFDYNMATGDLSNRRRFAEIDRADGIPDGMTIDSEGHLWVALYLGGAIRCYDPDGTWVGTIQLPVVGVTSCAFGGPDLRDLYITSAAHLAGRRERPRSPLDGALFRCRLETPGLPEPKFPH